MLPVLAMAAVFNAFLTAPVQVPVGEMFAARLEVDARAHGFNGYEATVTYDATALEFVNVSEGALMLGACGLTFVSVDATPGSVRYTHVILCNQISLDGPGVLSLFRFTAGASGRTVLDVDGMFIDAGELIPRVVWQGVAVSVVGFGRAPIELETWGRIKAQWRDE